jgi:DNA-binding NarL/FixJ family response regulator
MIKITIVEDHTLFRKGIISLLEKVKDFKVVAEFSNGAEYIENLFDLQTDIVLMDSEMTKMSGIETSMQSNIKRPEIKIIALSMYSDQKYYYEMIKTGISGFVLKEATPEELEKAIRDVHVGLGFFSPKLLQEVIVNIPEIEKRNQNVANLQITKRELEILDLICKGLTNKKISDILFLSPRTVESHKTKMMRKTNTKNTPSLIIFAVKNKLIEI